MGTAAQLLTFEQFQEIYGSDSNYEFWYGEAIERSMPTVLHGLLQYILMRLLGDAGFLPMSEVELRIVREAHPKPDVIASRHLSQGPYPTGALEIAIEILSDNDRMAMVIGKCRAYRQWGFERILVVEPTGRQVFLWGAEGLSLTTELVSGVPVDLIWSELDSALARTR